MQSEWILYIYRMLALCVIVEVRSFDRANIPQQGYSIISYSKNSFVVQLSAT